MLAAVVESSSAKEQVVALLDLIDLYLSGQGTEVGIALLLHEPHPEAVAALEVGSGCCERLPTIRFEGEEGRQ